MAELTKEMTEDIPEEKLMEAKEKIWWRYQENWKEYKTKLSTIKCLILFVDSVETPYPCSTVYKNTVSAIMKGLRLIQHELKDFDEMETSKQRDIKCDLDKLMNEMYDILFPDFCIFQFKKTKKYFNLIFKYWQSIHDAITCRKKCHCDCACYLCTKCTCYVCGDILEKITNLQCKFSRQKVEHKTKDPVFNNIIKKCDCFNNW